MRARNIKPGFFENEELHELSIPARLIFIGMWCMADREGRLQDRPKKIKLQLVPYDDVDIHACLDQLTDHGFIIRYSVNGEDYIQISTFTKHQSPHKHEKQSIIPPPMAVHRQPMAVHSQPMAVTCMNDVKETLQSSTVHVPPSTVHAQPLANHGDAMYLKCHPDSLNPDCLNPDSLNPDSHNPNSLLTEENLIHRQTTPKRSFDGVDDDDDGQHNKPLSLTDKRLRKPSKGRKADSTAWVNALGNGLKDWFENEFWPIQRRKVNKKEAAMAVYDLNPGDDLRSRIIGAYMTQDELEFAHREIEHVPHPATWLNGSRWEDEVKPSAYIDKRDDPFAGTVIR